VERNPPDPNCAPRPGPADIQLLNGAGSVVAEGQAGSDGRFVVQASPGTYGVAAHTIGSSSPGRGCQSDPSEVKVAAGTFTSVKVSCDTGIR